MELIGKTNLDFIGKRYFAYALSALLCALGLAAFIAIGFGRANLGIDFAGGTAVQVKFQRPVDVGTMRAAFGAGGLPDAELQLFAGADRALIRVKRGAVGIGGVADQIRGSLQKALPDNPFVVEGSNEVGPAVGKDLQQAALLAIAVSLAGIIAYIWVRFEFKFGIAATIATFHDVLTVLGVFFLLNKEITLLIVTALLTIAGYSLTDTVVIYDRIRENLRAMRREDLGTVMNVSINQVLSRTAMTSLTTLLASASLFFVGGEVLRDFSLALILGIIVGSYSSWFVASPIVYEWRIRQRAAARAR